MVSYERSEEIWLSFGQIIRGWIDTHGMKRVCDLGGGAHPLLPLDFITSRNLEFYVLDISWNELKKADDSYNKIVQDLTARDICLPIRFELIYSKMLAEHVKDAKQLHKNIFSLLDEGGIAVHFFPTLYAIPFVFNRLIPERLSHKVLSLLSNKDRLEKGKFISYYNWCRGPTRKMVKRFEKIGYEVLEFKGLFGHDGYYKKIPVLLNLHQRLTTLLLRYPIPYLTSFSYLVLRKSSNRGV